MPTVEVAGRSFEVDGSGFMKDHTVWTVAIGKALAKGAGVELGPRHLAVMQFLRSHYDCHEKLPRVHELCVGLPTSIRELYELFPAGLSLACKFAGLPRPGCG